LVITETKI